MFRLAAMRGGADAGAFPLRCPGWSREVRCEAHPRGMAVQRREAWTEPGLQAVWHLYLRVDFVLVHTNETRTKHEYLTVATSCRDVSIHAN